LAEFFFRHKVFEQICPGVKSLALESNSSPTRWQIQQSLWYVQATWCSSYPSALGFLCRLGSLLNLAMAHHTTKGDSFTPLSSVEALETIRSLQQSQLNTETRLQQIEEGNKTVAAAQNKLEEKLDGIHKMMLQWNLNSEFGSSQKSPRPPTTQPACKPNYAYT
jgi:hypothetical protein